MGRFINQIKIFNMKNIIILLIAIFAISCNQDQIVEEYLNGFDSNEKQSIVSNEVDGEYVGVESNYKDHSRSVDRVLQIRYMDGNYNWIRVKPQYESSNGTWSNFYGGSGYITLYYVNYAPAHSSQKVLLLDLDWSYLRCARRNFRIIIDPAYGQCQEIELRVDGDLHGACQYPANPYIDKDLYYIDLQNWYYYNFYNDDWCQDENYILEGKVQGPVNRGGCYIIPNSGC